MNIVCIIGTRAQLIKMAPVLLIMEKKGVQYRLIFTGQHSITMRELLEDFEVKTKPYFLYQGREVTSVPLMLLWTLRILTLMTLKHKDIFGEITRGKDAVLVHGDTVSTLVGGIAGYLLGMRVVHVESGLRSFDFSNPFPEELIRIILFRLSSLAYCPGRWACRNLEKYNVEKVNTVENTLLDSVEIAKHSACDELYVLPERYGVISLHRFENVFRGERLVHIVSEIEKISAKYKLAFVLHPSTESRLEKAGLIDRLKENNNIVLMPRMSYFPFIKLVRKSLFVVTDGGSNQEELYYLRIPTFILRVATERKEGLGTNAFLVRPDSDDIACEIFRRLDGWGGSVEEFVSMEGQISPSNIIVDDLIGRYY